MTDEDENGIKTAIFNTLRDTGCCKRCILRYLTEPAADFDNPDKHISSLHLNNVNHKVGSSEQKRLKTNPCVICLDLLHEDTLEKLVSSPNLRGVLEYDSDTFVNYISFPTAVLIREHCMEVHMSETFPNFYKGRLVIPINKAWSWSMQNQLGEKIHKKFNKDSNFQIQFTMSYALEEEESSVISHIANKETYFNGQGNKLSRNMTGEFLKKIEPEMFRKHFTIPPQPPTEGLTLQQVTYKYEAIYIGGRYCKYSRAIGQTPWVVDDVKVVENSVQEVIFKPLQNIFNCGCLVFTASGREDFDVRTLGRGRPFFVKVCNLKNTKLSFEQFREIEHVIKQSNMVTVRDLQFIDRKCLNTIKEGEQFKQKTYRALCVVDQPDRLESYVEKINHMSEVELQQKTPLRVYHRRSSSVRPKTIYSMVARLIEGRSNLFELDLVTQAGTYVKEFIHGDLGRTKPSLSCIIDGYVDFVALDVLDIHLDFPPTTNI